MGGEDVNPTKHGIPSEARIRVLADSSERTRAKQE